MFQKGIDTDYTEATMPDMDIPLGQRNEAWHRKCIRYFSTFYNQRSMVYDTSEDGYYLSPLEQMKENYSFVLGRQVNKDYAYLATDGVSNTQDALGIVAGQKVAQIIEWMRGRFLEMISNMDLQAVSLSENAKGQQTAMFEKLMISYLLKPELEKIAKEDGVQFAPAGPNFNPEIKEDIYRYMERDFGENMRIVSKDLAEDILHNNYYKKLFLSCATHVLTAGRCLVDVMVENGNVKWNIVPPHMGILDTSYDDDFLSKARFGGYVEYMSVPEVVSRWKDFHSQGLKSELELLKKIASGEASTGEPGGLSIDSLNASNTTFKWWNNGNRGCEVACVKMYWQTTEDLGYIDIKDRFGNRKLHPKQDESQSTFSDTTYRSWRQGWLIGNLFLRDWGQINNRWGALEGKPELDMPLKQFMPGMLMGENRSVVDRLKKHQDRLDAYRRKITDIASRSAGRGIIINGAAFGITEGSKVVADLKRDGVSVINMESGEPGDDMKRDQNVWGVDMTTDPSMRFYIELIREEERNMEEIANIPKIAQGTKSSYVGAGVQDRTLAQSNLGTATTYFGFIDWASHLVQYSVNVAKYAMTSGKDNYTAKLKLGDYGFTFAKITRELRLEEAGVWFKVKDVIDESAKQRIRAYAQSFSQNPEWGIGPDDIIRLEKARTWTEMIEDLEYSIAKKKRENKQAQAYQDLLAQVQGERQANVNAQNAQLAADTSRANNQENVAGKIITEAMKKGQQPAGMPA